MRQGRHSVEPAPRAAACGTTEGVSREIAATEAAEMLLAVERTDAIARTPAAIVEPVGLVVIRAEIEDGAGCGAIARARAGDAAREQGGAAGEQQEPAADKARTDKARTDKAGTDKAGTDKAGTDKAGTDKAGTDKAGTDKAGTDKAGTDKAGTDKAGPDL